MVKNDIINEYCLEETRPPGNAGLYDMRKLDAQSLNKKRKRFCREYIKDLNATQAAVRAGYSAKTADQAASRMLRIVKVRDYIALLMQERSEATRIDAAWVLREMKAVHNMNAKDILNEAGGFKPILEWPDVWTQYISGMDMTEIFAGQGDDRAVAGVLKKIKWPDKIKNLEMIGKHVDVQAWKEQVGLTGSLALVESVKDIIALGATDTFVLPGGDKQE